MGPDYRLVRTVKFTPRKVEVSDQFTNLHADAKLGLLVENALDLKGASASVRLAGNADPDRVPDFVCAYNRTAHLAERRKMMQQWADYLDTLRGTSPTSTP